MAGIENQGRHDHEGFKELAGDLWSNKPLLIVVLAGLALVVYMLARKSGSAIAVPASNANPAPGTSSGPSSGGYFLGVLEEQPEPPSNVQVTVNTPAPTTGHQKNPPPKKPPKPPILPPGPPPRPVPAPKPPTKLPPTPAPKPVLKKLPPKPAPKPVLKPVTPVGSRTGGPQRAGGTPLSPIPGPNKQRTGGYQR